MPRPRRRNPWTSTGEVFIWVLFVVLLFPAGFAGWAVGHYTSLGSTTSTVVHTVTLGTTSAPATTTSAATTTATGTTTNAAGGGNVAAGKAVFAANNCAGCHTFKPANATGTIGPNLDTEPAISAKADHNMDLAKFIKQSIVDPNAYIAKGYSPNIMTQTFGKTLSSTQLNDLVAFVLSGTSKS